MNRSLEALAILVMCLVGILAAVRISTKDQASASRTAIPPPSVGPAKDTPAKPNSSAVEATSEPNTECLAQQSPDYQDGCGLDRATGQVYRPLAPLLSPSEFAVRVIRSQPLPLIVLPEAEENHELTGYDPTYDEAIWGQLATCQNTAGDLASVTIDYQQVEAEYAAAELAAAQGESSLIRWSSSLLQDAREQLERAGDATIASAKDYQRGVIPVLRAINIRWTEHVAPKLRLFPRPPATARHKLLLQQRASQQQPGVSWSDYLSFVERNFTPHVARDRDANEALRSR